MQKTARRTSSNGREPRKKKVTIKKLPQVGGQTWANIAKQKREGEDGGGRKGGVRNEKGGGRRPGPKILEKVKGKKNPELKRAAN